MCHTTYLQNGDSALMKAAWRGYTEIVIDLMKAEANLNLQNKVLTVLCMFATVHTCT